MTEAPPVWQLLGAAGGCLSHAGAAALFVAAAGRSPATRAGVPATATTGGTTADPENRRHDDADTTTYTGEHMLDQREPGRRHVVRSRRRLSFQ